ncbi:3,4-dihydroxy-2-butanone-4-phosphate synthase [Paenibacillus xerothermodurans]|uniref:Riboflavin kinase domain-containing protein n=1 Tax=Paenibacillus xerothermodurans TaxID=1977292 RepID=A0A2W1NUG7_PAEXE|nr:3,4-dihydroxy-2-butanone-4-phosphate synthase [Paenibacillus xerothermodurans]PZE21396.1 hypothetical protein CBW46_008545 [Paenibacillus xerothermodurans]
MSALARSNLYNRLKNAELVVVYDDVQTKVGSLVGVAERVTPQTVNLMTKLGKGLIYVCITEEKGEQLNLPLMVRGSMHSSQKPLTVSVDHNSTTTGISAYERSDTIRAFTQPSARADHFRRPGHVFPILSKDKGLMHRVGIAEAAVELAKMISAEPVAYASEILNQAGEIASAQEIIQIAELNDLCIINISDMLEFAKDELLSSFTGLVVRGRELGRKIGFPTANLYIDAADPLDHGVYGVTVRYNDVKYRGIMNVGVRPTFRNAHNEVHYEVHLLNFNGMIYGKTIHVDVDFFIRHEIAFPTVEHLINQIDTDIAYVEHRFGLVKIQ